MPSRILPPALRMLAVFFAVGIALVAMAALGTDLAARGDADTACLAPGAYPSNIEESDNPLIGTSLSWFPLTYVCDYHRQGGGSVRIALTDGILPTICLYLGGVFTVGSVVVAVAVTRDHVDRACRG